MSRASISARWRSRSRTPRAWQPQRRQGGGRAGSGRQDGTGAVLHAGGRPRGEAPLLHHIGLYAYRRSALARFVSLPPSYLEQQEKLEQLRALAAGMRIDVAIVDAVPLGVDTPADLAARPGVAVADQIITSLFEQKPGHVQIHVHRLQGSPGAYSDLSCRTVFPDRKTMPCATFEDVFAAVHEGAAEYGMIPVENSVAGQVADNITCSPRRPAHHR